MQELLQSSAAPRWTARWLIAAGIYNLLWGCMVIAWPNALFDLAGADRMRYPEIWQCVGMIVGVYGIGYLIAARDPRRHWPIVLVGLLGKVFGPIGFAIAVARDVFPPSFALTILTNDLIWWIPFVMILWDAARSSGAPRTAALPLDQALRTLTDQSGATLQACSVDQPLLCVFLRHSGCTFCRETLAELKSKQAAIRDHGYRLAIITMSASDENMKLARRHDLESAHWVSDPERHLYRACELRRGRFMQLFGPAVFVRGLAALLRGHGIGRLRGDGFQLPGAVVLESGKIIRAFRAERASDRPDYSTLACEIHPR